MGVRGGFGAVVVFVVIAAGAVVGGPAAAAGVASPAQASGRWTATPAAAVPVVGFPSFCRRGTTTVGSRTEVCKVERAYYRTYRTINGVRTQTGQVDMLAYQYAYSNADQPIWADQIGVLPERGWGEALQGTVTGSAEASGKCTAHEAASFPEQALAPMDGRFRTGTVLARTTVTLEDELGTCPLKWTLRFSHPDGLSTVTTVSFDMVEIYCDNATGVNGFRPRRIGCVAWRFIPTVVYSRAQYPNLARHVSLAQLSGLPGRPGTQPLSRETYEPTIDYNRRLSCGDAPSIPAMSCDEYPLASSRHGLAFGGARRTQDRCGFPDLPTNLSGRDGVSVCMIPAAENHAQGAIMAAFYYDNRVLDSDRYWVQVGP